ncbi:MAG: response regulator [Desulfamplus sp.]|nr:response regulator [Desulfamplus sp.]
MGEKIVVILDDQSEVLLRIKTALEIDRKYECLICTNPESAKKAINTFAVHAVVTDVCLDVNENVNGFEFAKQIKEMGYTGKIAIMTGYIPNKIPDEYYGLFDVFFRKPFQISELRQWLDSF